MATSTDSEVTAAQRSDADELELDRMWFSRSNGVLERTTDELVHAPAAAGVREHAAEREGDAMAVAEAGADGGPLSMASIALPEPRMPLPPSRTPARFVGDPPEGYGTPVPLTEERSPFANDPEPRPDAERQQGR